MAIWVFHGTKDPVIPIKWARNMSTAMTELQIPFRYTEYPDAEHEIPGLVMKSAEFFPWLFQQRKLADSVNAEANSGK